jgi:micrococcal nuclease
MPFEYKANVIRVIDGDTIAVDIDLGFCFWLKNQTVRLLGIDAPELHSKDREEVKFGLRSKGCVIKFCESCNNSIILQTEIQDVISGNKEKFGRILALVKNPKTGEILNEELINSCNAVFYDGKQSKALLVSEHLKNRSKLFEGEFN